MDNKRVGAIVAFSRLTPDRLAVLSACAGLLAIASYVVGFWVPRWLAYLPFPVLAFFTLGILIMPLAVFVSISMAMSSLRRISFSANAKKVRRLVYMAFLCNGALLALTFALVIYTVGDAVKNIFE